MGRRFRLARRDVPVEAIRQAGDRSSLPGGGKAFLYEGGPARPELALCVDVLAPEGYGEIIGGGERAEDLDYLLKQIKDHNLPEDAFEWYLDLRRYGTFPHGGFGMGIERAPAGFAASSTFARRSPFRAPCTGCPRRSHADRLPNPVFRIPATIMKIGFVSLGCPKNLVDSEVMIGLSQRAGHELTTEQADADALIVNTCAFIDAAKQESISAILEMAELKKTGSCKRSSWDVWANDIGRNCGRRFPRWTPCWELATCLGS